MDVNVTISVRSADISTELFGKAEEFLEKECISGLCSFKCGGALYRLHLQMVCRLLTYFTVMVSKRLKQNLGWDDPKNAPMGYHILTRGLCNTGLYTFFGMLGYCIKDEGHDHFQYVQRNVSDAQLEGVEEYIKHGTPFAKNQVILTHTNLIERDAIYCKYKMRKQLGSTLLGILLPMLQSAQYIPSASWVVHVCQNGLEYKRAAAIWKGMMDPHAIEMNDVAQIFFEYTNPSSCLADLGCQRLAFELEGVYEDDVLVLPHLDLNNIIFIDGTQEDISKAYLHETDDGTPAYIPVFYGDRDFENDLIV